MEGNFPRRLPSLNYGGANGKNNVPNDAANNHGRGRQQEQYMPIPNVARVMRRGLPDNVRVADNAKETMRECVSEFIGFVTNEANAHCKSKQRKTVTAEDLLWSLGKLGFDDYVAPLSMYLARYRHVESGRTSVRGQPLQVPPFGPNYDYKLPSDEAHMGQVVADLGQVIGMPVPQSVNDEFGGDMAKYFGDGYDVGASSSSCPALPDFDPYADLK